MSDSLSELADQIDAIEQRVSEAIFDAVRAQLREGDTTHAGDLEKRLSRVRRSLQKAQALLRGGEGD